MSAHAHIALSLYLDGIPSSELEYELVQRKVADTAVKIESALAGVEAMRRKQERRMKVLDQLAAKAPYQTH